MPDHALPSIGMVGTGKMGGPMCRRLLAAGYRVSLFGRTPERLAPLLDAGADARSSLAQLASSVDVLLTCLDTVAACEDVALSTAGLVANARPGTLLIELSTIAPTLAQRVGSAAALRGVLYADAPVSGGPEGAQHGTLAIMVGASAEAFEHADPVLRILGRTVVHMGGVGCGMQAKLVNQLLTFVHGAAAAEAIALAERIGLDVGRLGEVLGAGFGQSRMLERTLERVQRDNYDAGAALVLYAKDLGLLDALGAEAGLQLPMAAAAETILQGAIDAGIGARDIAALRRRYPAGRLTGSD